MSDHPGRSGKEPEPLGEAVRRRAARRRAARRKGRRAVWFGLGLFGLIGWSVALPTVLGAAVGAWLDGRSHRGVSWTLTFLLLGVVLGSFNAWRWIRQEVGSD